MAIISSLNEIDMHLHSNKELRVPFSEWIDGIIERGCKIAGLIDHIELYLNPQDPSSYQRGVRELMDFYSRVDELNASSDVLFLKGFEIKREGIRNIPDEALKIADYVGCCYYSSGVGTSWYQDIMPIIEILQSIAEKYDIPAIVFHPFRGIFSHAKRLVDSGERQFKSREEIITDDDLVRVVESIHSLKLFFEVNIHTARGYIGDNHPVVEFHYDAMAKLKDYGARFSIGSDYHAPPKEPVDFELYCQKMQIERVDIVNAIYCEEG